MGIERIVMKYIEYPEGATPLDYEESKGLLLTHIATQGELDFWEAKNIDQAMLWADKLKHRDLLNTDFICKLHKKMFSDVWRWAGKFRKSEKSIGVSPHKITVDLHALCYEADGWIEYNVYLPDEFAARFHHRLVKIHPFANGNGRLSRLMADLILEKIFSTDPFSWGGAYLKYSNETKQKYLAALRLADKDNLDYSLLLEFVRS